VTASTSSAIAPSLTELGARWLDQFSAEDKPTAKLLIDSLRIVSENELRVGLVERLRSLGENAPKPLVLLPVRNLRDFDGMKDSERPTAYVDYHPGSALQPLPGSEAIISNILREVIGVRIKTPGLLPPNASLATLRELRCRGLVFVTDYAGSGAQCLESINGVLRHPTLRSWRSFGWIEIHALVFAASNSAARRLRASGRIDHLQIIETAESFTTADWTESQFKAVKELCLRYADPARKARNEALGYRGSGGLFVMQHGVPNNLPAILLQPHRAGVPWVAPFPGRIFPVTLQAELLGYRPRPEMEVVTSVAVDHDLLAALTGKADRAQRPYLLTLAALAGRTQDIEQLAQALSTTTIRISGVIATLRTWGLIDVRNHLTDRGWSVLRRLRMRPRKVLFSLKGNDEPYYPMQLR
jgi:hypothetical protein